MALLLRLTPTLSTMLQINAGLDAAPKAAARVRKRRKQRETECY